MTTHVIVKAMRCCKQWEGCDCCVCIECPLYTADTEECEELKNQAADLIESLTSELETTRHQLEQVKQERDAWKLRAEAAELDIRSLIENTDCACDFCAHLHICKGCENEKTCSTDFEFGTCPAMKESPCNGCDFENHFQWRGPCAVNTNEKGINT